MGRREERFLVKKKAAIGGETSRKKGTDSAKGQKRSPGRELVGEGARGRPKKTRVSRRRCQGKRGGEKHNQRHEKNKKTRLSPRDAARVVGRIEWGSGGGEERSMESEIRADAPYKKAALRKKEKSEAGKTKGKKGSPGEMTAADNKSAGSGEKKKSPNYRGWENSKKDVEAWGGGQRKQKTARNHA